MTIDANKIDNFVAGYGLNAAQRKRLGAIVAEGAERYRMTKIESIDISTFSPKYTGDHDVLVTVALTVEFGFRDVCSGPFFIGERGGLYVQQKKSRRYIANLDVWDI